MWLVKEQVAVAAMDGPSVKLALQLVDQIRRQFPDSKRSDRLTVRLSPRPPTHPSNMRPNEFSSAASTSLRSQMDVQDALVRLSSDPLMHSTRKRHAGGLTILLGAGCCVHLIRFVAAPAAGIQLFVRKGQL